MWELGMTLKHPCIYAKIVHTQGSVGHPNTVVAVNSDTVDKFLRLLKQLLVEMQTQI
jgi:hypothetical protein